MIRGATLRDWYILAKPGLVYGNLFALVAGYGYGMLEGGDFSLVTMIVTTLATGLIMGAACVVNNIFDRDIDQAMGRTRQRALAAGRIMPAAAALYAVVLASIGLGLLAAIQIWLALLGAVGLITYGWVYTWLKRRTYHATLFGTIPGAIPPFIGYVAADGDDWLTIIAIGLIMVSWQMVHFYAIALMRHDDYTAAAIPTVSRVLGLQATRVHMLWWAWLAALGIVVSMFHTNSAYAVLSGCVALYWLYSVNPVAQDMVPWARQTFKLSLLFLVLWTTSIWISVGLGRFV